MKVNVNSQCGRQRRKKYLSYFFSQHKYDVMKRVNINVSLLTLPFKNLKHNSKRPVLVKTLPVALYQMDTKKLLVSFQFDEQCHYPQNVWNKVCLRYLVVCTITFILLNQEGLLNYSDTKGKEHWKKNNRDWCLGDILSSYKYDNIFSVFFKIAFISLLPGERSSEGIRVQWGTEYAAREGVEADGATLLGTVWPGGCWV